jgi:hypothetical protein
MLDWFSGLVGYSGDSLPLNRVLEISPAGEIAWQTESKLKVPGSFDSSIRVGRGAFTPLQLKPWENDGCVDYLTDAHSVLRIDGNPTKFLQGHNAFGPSPLDLGYVLKETINRFPDGIRPADVTMTLGEKDVPFFSSSRVDITTMVDFGDHRLVHDWLRVAATSTRTRHKIRHERDTQGLTGGATVYWGKSSTRWTLKAYCKYCELDTHPPGDRQLLEALKSYNLGKLRIELTLRSHELQKYNYYALSESLIWDYFSRVEVGVMKTEQVPGRKPNLKPAVDLAFTVWLSGGDVFHRLPRRTFYRYRRIILDETGLDISNAPDEKQIERQNFDIDWLREHEVDNVPDYLQGYLFAPNGYKNYKVALI